MSNKLVYEIEGPVTQSIEAVRAMATALGKPLAEGDLPRCIKLSRYVLLVLSAKEDCYYTTTRDHGCSCPASFYHPDKPCKHQRKYLGMEPIRITADEAEQLFAKSQKGGFKPTMEEAAEA